MARRSSLRQRILGANLATAVAFGVVLVTTLVAMKQAGQELEFVARGTVPLTRIVTAIQARVLPDLNVELFLADQRAADRISEHFKTTRLEIDHMMNQANILLSDLGPHAGDKRSVATHSQLKRELDLAQASWDRWSNMYDATLIVGREALHSQELLAALENEDQRNAIEKEVTAQRNEFMARSHQLLRAKTDVNRRLAALGELLDMRLAGAVGRAGTLQRKSTIWVAGLGVFAILVAAMSLWWVSTSVAPWSHLMAQVRGLSDGIRVEPFKGGGELGDVSLALSRVAETLQERAEQLRRAERLAAVGEVAAQITHEIRNPLNALGMNLEMLAEDPQAPDASEIWKSVIGEVDRLTNITDTYLQLARLPSGTPEPVALDVLLGELQTLMGAELAKRGIVLSSSFPAIIPDVLGDPEQLRRAFLNILSNATEAMDGGGRLELEISSDLETVSVRVADTGRGIDAQDLPHIFDPFFSRRQGGTGLGLAITDRIISDHEGSLELQSSVGVGTTAIITLPRKGLQ